MIRKYPQSKYWCFTLFNTPKFTDEKSLPKEVQYVIYQTEKAPTTDKQHYQGYIELKNRIRMTSLKSLFADDTVHLEPRIGTQEQAIHYCTKPNQGCNCQICTEERKTPTAIPNTIVQIGVKFKSESGKRNDLLAVQKEIHKGGSMLEVASKHFGSYIRYTKGLEKYRSMYIQSQIPTWNPPTVIVICGKAGIGKTRACYQYDPQLHKIAPPEKNGMVWFDGYDGQFTLLLDDFYGWIKYHTLLEFMDGYPCMLQTKGSHVQKNWNVVLITSNKSPGEWYKDHGLTPALERRITKILDADIMTDWKQLYEEVLKIVPTHASLGIPKDSEIPEDYPSDEEQHTPPPPEEKDKFDWNNVEETPDVDEPDSQCEIDE